MPIKKRRPTKSIYVYTEEGVLVVKTPAACTQWDNNFRIRIVRDYIAPKSLKLSNEFRKNFIENDYQVTTYKISGVDVMVRQPYQTLDNSNRVVVLKTEIIDVKKGKAMFLCHEDPAMRMLMVYSFIKGERLGGVPKLEVYDYEEQ